MPQTLGSGAGNIAATAVALSVVDWTSGAASAITTAGVNLAPTYSQPVPIAGNYRLQVGWGITGGVANAPTILTLRTNNPLQKLSGGVASTLVAATTDLAVWNKGSAFVAGDLSADITYAVDLALAAGDRIGNVAGSVLTMFLDGVAATATVRWRLGLVRVS